MIKLANKYDNFIRAVKRLNEANIVYKKDSANDIYQDALIKRFEFTFELAWKTLREFLINQGYQLQIGSPKGVLSMAYQEGYINEEQIWLEMLNDRNLTSHDYGGEIAANIAERISIRYAKELTRLSKFFTENI